MPTPRRQPPPAAAAAPVQTVAFVSLGCPKNLVDSEKMLGLLAEDGLAPVGSDDPADAIVINTCGFLEASKDESLAEVRAAVERKRRGEVRRVVVAGCLVQRHRAQILEWCPGVDALIGVFDRDKVIEAVRGPRCELGADVAVDLPVYSSIAANATLARRRRGVAGKGYFEDDAGRLRLTPRHYAYLRISEGCNQNCSFCTIPSIRGKMRSKPPEAILAEARELIADGAFELNLIGQDTTSYGDDIGYGPGLVGLLESLDRAVRAERGGLPGWIRLMYAYPSCFTDAMIDAIARLASIVKYIDMPLQHINDAVLDRMKRRTSRRLIEALLAKLRDRVPGIAIRTTFISGFPGETDAQHRELVEFVRQQRFEAMGVFAYSPEPGTPAGTLHARGEAVPAAVVAARVEELMLTQQEAAFARNEAMAGQAHTSEVLIDAAAGRSGRSHGYVGRLPSQAPQIDAVTHVRSRQRLAVGEVVTCRITGARGYDLIATPTADLEARVRLPVVGAAG